MLTLQRVKENPIVQPSRFAWENLAVFNPGVVEYNNEILLLYRALGTKDQVSRIGIARSTDGIHFTKDRYAMYYGGQHPSEILGIEDIRAVQIDNTYYLVYTAVSPQRMGHKNAEWNTQSKKPQIALSTTKDFKNFMDYDVIIPHIEGKDATLFPKKLGDEFLLIYREGSEKTYIADSPRLDYWPQKYFLFDKRPGFWDSKRVGIGNPPIATEKGWLLFYHGIDERDVYRLGILFLDLQDPRKILYRSPEPVFEPTSTYEKFGYVSNVVFTCGAIEKNDAYYVYYGAGDEVIGLATVQKKDVLSLL